MRHQRRNPLRGRQRARNGQHRVAGTAKPLNYVVIERSAGMPASRPLGLVRYTVNFVRLTRWHVHSASFLPSFRHPPLNLRHDIISTLTTNLQLWYSAFCATSDCCQKPSQSENVHVVSSRVAPDVKFGRSRPKSGRFVHWIWPLDMTAWFICIQRLNLILFVKSSIN